MLRKAGDYGNIHIYHEFQINWEYSVADTLNHNALTPIACKSLLDSCTFDWDEKVCTIMDIKTTAKLWHFEDSMNEFDYCRQLCFYQEAVEMYLEEQNIDLNDWEFEYYIIAIDTTGKNEVRVFKIQTHQVYDRAEAINDAMSDILWHIGTDNWDHSRKYYEGDGSETLNL